MWNRLLLAMAILTCSVSTASADTGTNMVLKVRDLLGQRDTLATYTTWTNTDIKRMLATAMAGVIGEAMTPEADTVIHGGLEANSPPPDFLGFSGPGILMRNNEFVAIIPVISADSLYRMGVRPTEENMGFDNHVMVWMGNKIWILPAPNANDSVKVSYFNRPTILIDTSENPLTVEWEYVVIYSAAAIGYASLEDWNGYDRMVLERDKRLDALRAVEVLKQKTSPQVVP